MELISLTVHSILIGLIFQPVRLLFQLYLVLWNISIIDLLFDLGQSRIYQ